MNRARTLIDYALKHSEQSRRELNQSCIAVLSAPANADYGLIEIRQRVRSLTITSVIQSKLGTFTTASTGREKVFPANPELVVATEASSPGTRVLHGVALFHLLKHRARVFSGVPLRSATRGSRALTVGRSDLQTGPTTLCAGPPVYRP